MSGINGAGQLVALQGEAPGARQPSAARDVLIVLPPDATAEATSLARIRAPFEANGRHVTTVPADDGVAACPEGQPPKSNWALPLDSPPCIAYGVACGITFTCGGLTVDTWANVLDTEGRPMPELYATGAIIGDSFYFNCVDGAGLMRAAVFGRIAGESAAAAALEHAGAAGARRA